MPQVEHVSLVVEEDFLERQSCARPVSALAELIWNALDGEATTVTVEFERSDLAGGISKIAIYDNGFGFPRSDAPKLFGKLGGSWKRQTRRTREKQRMIHGQEGRGRYKAFALGRSAVWKVSYDNTNDERKSFEISLLEPDLNDVSITDEQDAPTHERGVIVEITDTKKDFSVLSSYEGIQELTEVFALYLMNYRDVSIRIDGHELDPETAIASQENKELPSIKDSDGNEYPAGLHIIEWKKETKRTLYLCSEDSFPLDQVETRFHIQGFSFSAYLTSPYVTLLHNDGRLGLAEMDRPLRDSVDVARDTITQYFRERAAERAKAVVDEWKAEDIYPFEGEPITPVDKVERQVFDIVAVTVQDLAPDLISTKPKTRALHLRMLRNAIERGPEELQLILREVLDLPPRKQKELATLLQETTLSAIITAAKTVADRLKFVTALESIVFDPETKGRLKERSQLHRILAENTWILGEEYNLWVSDKGLKKVLEAHKEHFAPDIVIDDPVKLSVGKRGIVDLMLSRAARRHRADDIEHLVVELKAPRVKIGAQEITQAKKYAFAVEKDERFRTVKGLRWHFWLVSNAYDDFTESEINGGPDPARRLISKTERVSVGVKTWGELIEENWARLQYIQEHLEHAADESDAIRHLHERHSKFLEGVVDFAEDKELAPET